MSITCCECVCVALGIRHATRMRHVNIWPLRLYNIVSLCLINGTIFETKKLIEHKIRVLTSSTTVV